MADIRVIESTGVDRAAVDGIRNRLIELAADKKLFSRSDFPVPKNNIGGNFICFPKIPTGDLLSTCK